MVKVTAINMTFEVASRLARQEFKIAELTCRVGKNNFLVKTDQILICPAPMGGVAAVTGCISVVHMPFMRPKTFICEDAAPFVALVAELIGKGTLDARITIIVILKKKIEI